jgi:hypothetical protein
MAGAPAPAAAIVVAVEAGMAAGLMGVTTDE